MHANLSTDKMPVDSFQQLGAAKQCTSEPKRKLIEILTVAKLTNAESQNQHGGTTLGGVEKQKVVVVQRVDAEMACDLTPISARWAHLRLCVD
jgi:hypothetical protein